MALENTSLQEEVDEIFSKGPTAVNYEWSAILTTPNGTLTPMRVLGIDINRNYVDNYSDEIFVDLSIPLGTYQHQIVPWAKDLTITLQRTAVLEGTDEDDLSQDIASQEMRATLIKVSSLAVEGDNTFSADESTANLISIERITFQLVDLALEQTRFQSVGGILKNCTVMDAIKYFVTKIAQNLDVDVNHKIQGVDVVDPDNTKVYSHINVEHGTPATDVPSYIAHHAGAPYSTGMGAYLQKSIWYIYPLYDLTRYDNAQKTCTIINVPSNRMPSVSRTFRKTFNQIILLATGSNKHIDPSEHLQLAHGNGVRYADAEQTMNGFVTVKDNKATALREQNANEYTVESRSNKLNNVRMSDARITANTFEEMGKTAMRLGSILTVTWENSDPGSIVPGMGVRYLYEINEKVFELKGVILKAQTQITSKQPGLYPGPHRSNTALTLFLQKTLDWSDSSAVSG